MKKLTTWTLPLLSSQAEYEDAKCKLAVAVFEEKIIEPRSEEEGATFKIMKEEKLDFLQRVPVYANNRLAQSVERVKKLELQLLVYLVQSHPNGLDRLSPVPHEADGLSWGVSLVTGIPHIQPRESKGYGVQGPDAYPIDGRLEPGDRVGLIEGTSSTYRSILAEALRYKARGATVPHAYAVFTYEWGNPDLLESEGCRFEFVMTVREAFGIALENNETTKVTKADHDRVCEYLIASEHFYRGDHTRERAKELGLLRAGC